MPGKNRDSARLRRTSGALAPLGCGVLATTLLHVPGAAAQESPAAEDKAGTLSEVVVSARRREEKLTEVPLAISALTNADFEKRDLTDLVDVAKLTPGFTITTYSAQRARRDSPIFTVRGILPASAASRPGAGIFVNGAPAANGQAAYLGDLDRVEVIKGPQAAYFGRATFAGAINLVPRRPSAELGASLEAVGGQHDLRDFRGSVEGALGVDWLRARASARDYSRGGMFTSASDGSDLTEQNSRSFSFILDAQPGDQFKARLAALYNRNEDGYPTYAKLNFASFNCAADAPTAAATFNPANQNNFICGEVPRLASSRIGGDFVITPYVYDVFFNNSLGLPNADRLGVLSRDPAKSDVSESYHVNLTADYTLESGPLDGFTVSYLGAWNRRNAQFLTNSIAEPVNGVANPYYLGAPGAARVPNVLPFPTFYIFSLTREASVDNELRIASDPKKRLRGMLGVSEYRVLPYVSALWGFTSNAPGISFGASAANSTVTLVKTTGVFGNLAFDFTDRLTLNLEGRYQEDRIKVKNRGTGTVLLPPDIKDPAFMPRASLQYKVTPDLNAYFSFASSSQPKGYNTVLVGRPLNTAYALANAGVGVTYDGEQIDMFELGLKGSVLDGRLAFALAVYDGKWKDQVIQQRIIVPTSLDGLPAGNILTLLTNGGRTNLRGLEIDANARITDHFSIGGSLGYNDTEIRRYECVPCLLNVTGSADVTGNSLPLSPKLSGNLFAEYRGTLAGEWGWYGNAQYIHAGKMYTDETNLSWSPQRNTVDLRFGLERGGLTVEAFALNAFDSYYVTVAQRDQDIWTASVNLPGVKPSLAAAQGYLNNSFNLGLGDRRTLGVRARYRF